METQVFGAEILRNVFVGAFVFFAGLTGNETFFGKQIYDIHNKQDRKETLKIQVVAAVIFKDRKFVLGKSTL